MAKSKADEWLEKDKLTLLEAWARDGLTDEQIANNIGISRSTLFEWRKKNQDISNALKKGKEVVDIEVENALYKKALGYNVLLKKTFKLKKIEYNNDGKKIKEYEELVDGYDETHIPADTTAQIFWLKNRNPRKWRDKVEVETNKQELSKLDELLGEIKKDANK